LDREEQILNWYRQLTAVTSDDKADFEVMLMDKRNTTDARCALMGMMMNILEVGFNPDVMNMLFAATGKDINHSIQFQAMTALCIGFVLHDPSIRQYPELIERMLDLLAEQREQLIGIVCSLNTLNRHMLTIGKKPDIRQSLLYRLVIVGEAAHQAFDQSDERLTMSD